MFRSSSTAALLVTLSLAATCNVLLAAEKNEWIQLFNGKDLNGWRFQEPVQNSQWTVGTAALDPADPRKLVVTPGGNELINPVGPQKVISAHGKGVDIYTEAKFGDAVVELEVMMAKESNSGIYLMGEYEVQVMDSFGKAPDPKGMGGIYGVAAPRSNPCKPPGEWQKFVIDYRAPRFDAAANKTANARIMKVTLNGTVIHEDVELPHALNGGLTTGGTNIRGIELRAGPLMFQGNHGPVAYRNIRIKPLRDPANAESWVNPPKEPIPGVEHRRFQSVSMKRAVGFNIYLPPGYADAAKRFPVVYYLHGSTDCESTHPQLFGILDKAIRAGEVPPMILVYTMCGRTSLYADSPDGQVMGETVFIKELIPHVDQTVRTIASREGRAVMGFSMGGAGAIRFACKYPELFSSAVSLSGGFTTGEFERSYNPANFRRMFVDDVKRFDAQSALTLACASAGKVPLRLAVGTKDVHLERNRKMKAVLEEQKIGLEYEEIEGVAHKPPLVFEAQGLKAFQFHARQFRLKGPP